MRHGNRYTSHAEKAPPFTKTNRISLRTFSHLHHCVRVLTARLVFAQTHALLAQTHKDENAHVPTFASVNRVVFAQLRARLHGDHINSRCGRLRARVVIFVWLVKRHFASELFW